ncbi:MAG TPA: hypothetical protein VMZ91_12910 [Candidatus Paceibacterota bacterium]|nr:hypothetical protein [Candidatus Paceibacterota bacterium]
MIKKRNFREKIVKNLYFYLPFFIISLTYAAVLGYSVSGVAKPSLTVLASILGGFLSSYVFFLGYKSGELDKIKNNLTQAYSDILDKSFLNPDKK